MKTILLRNRLVLCATVIWTFLTCAALFSQEEVTRSQLSARPAGEPRIIWNRESGQAVLTNGRLEINIETKSSLNARSFSGRPVFTSLRRIVKQATNLSHRS